MALQFRLCLFIAIVFVYNCHGFYLPGLAPVNYCPKSVLGDKKCPNQISVYVNRLDSAESLIPYEYGHFDFCQAAYGESSPVENLGQVVLGDRIRPSPYKFNFNEEISAFTCDKTYKAAETKDMRKLKNLRNAIKQNYQHHWIIDHMPLASCFTFGKSKTVVCYPGFPVGCYTDSNGKGKVGCHSWISNPEPNTTYLFNHVNISIGYQPKQLDWPGNPPDGAGRLVMARVVNLGSIMHTAGVASPEEGLKANKSLALSAENQDITIRYSFRVSFQVNNYTKWSSRWDYISDSSRWDYILYPIPSRDIEWLSILYMVYLLEIVILFSGMVAKILLRILRPDIASYSRCCKTPQQEFGWKFLHGDVFRPPHKGMILSVFLGSGVQIFFMTLITLIFACSGLLSPANRGGALMTCALVLYVCLGTPAGYISSRIYKMFGGEKWKSNFILTAFLCPGIIFGIFFTLNLIFWGVGSSAAVPFTTLLAFLALWFGVSVPLTFVGAYFGFKKRAIEHPVKTNQIPRHIPDLSFHKKPFVGMGGIVPLGCIFVQLFFIFSSVWSYWLYNMFRVLFLVFVILVITCSEMTVVFCYVHLCAEDYRWWWKSFLTSGSTAFYFFLYSIYFYVTQLEMEGFLNAFLYFGYTFIVTFLLFLLTGTIGFFACFCFVKKIYSVVHVIACLTHDVLI